MFLSGQHAFELYVPSSYVLTLVCHRFSSQQRRSKSTSKVVSGFQPNPALPPKRRSKTKELVDELLVQQVRAKTISPSVTSLASRLGMISLPSPRKHGTSPTHDHLCLYSPHLSLHIQQMLCDKPRICTTTFFRLSFVYSLLPFGRRRAQPSQSPSYGNARTGGMRLAHIARHIN